MKKWDTIENGPFKPTWDSLRTFECPEWFRDAKLGIWSHWGPQSVPMYGDWYARNMYIEGSDQYLQHWRTWGHPSQYGWKDVCAQWKAERFDPEALMDLYVQAGAQYFVAQAMHHDNFDTWDSAHNRFNALNVGPKKDILGMFRQAALARHLPFGVTEHLAASFTWWEVNKGCDQSGPYAGVPYDGVDPQNSDFYHDNGKNGVSSSLDGRWYTNDPAWHAHWFDRIKDLIDKYKPDLLYSDGPLPFDEYGLGIVAHLYNTSIKEHGINHAVYNQKDRNPLVYTIGVLDIERSVQKDKVALPWQTDTCVGGWFYDVRQIYKSPKQVIEMLVDIVAKNGNLLLNFPQRPDGTLDDECLYILTSMAKWIAINGEGIFGTRPWYIAAEGDVAVVPKGFDEPELEYTPTDYRFTCKGNAVYAFQLGWPQDGQALIKSFSAGAGSPLKVVDVDSVELLGYGKVGFRQTAAGLELTGLPEVRPVKYAHCFKIILK
jgi:alpha-L-fucosidase